MKTDPWGKLIKKVAQRRRHWESRNSDIGERDKRAEPCNYCGLAGAHVKGRNCPAYGAHCEICRKFDHYSSVCRANTSPTDEMYALPRTHGYHQKRKVVKAEKTYSSSESSDDEFLAKSIGHLRVKTVKKSDSLNELPQTEISILHEQVTELGKELETTKEVIKNLVAQHENYRYHPSMQIDDYMQNFQRGPAHFSKSDKNEERKLRDLTADTKNDEVNTMTSRHSDIEKSEMESNNQDKTQRMKNDTKLLTFYKAKRRRSNRRKGKRH